MSATRTSSLTARGTSCASLGFKREWMLSSDQSWPVSFSSHCASSALLMTTFWTSIPSCEHKSVQSPRHKIKKWVVFIILILTFEQMLIVEVHGESALSTVQIE